MQIIPLCEHYTRVNTPLEGGSIGGNAVLLSLPSIVISYLAMLGYC